MKQIKLHTTVEAAKAPFGIGYDNSTMLIGSCFTENMGERMRQLGFDVMVNPFGILYNPLSIADALTRILDDKEIGEEHLVFRDGLWHSWLHHGSFSRADKAECLAACNEELHRAHAFMQRCDTIVVTLGSAWYYILNENENQNQNQNENENQNGQPISAGRHQANKNVTVVANCHKVPAGEFERHLASVDDVVSAWQPLLQRLRSMEATVSPQLQNKIRSSEEKRIVFTVSPVRHAAYGAHGNRLGKAVLLLSIDQLISQFSIFNSQLSYFPAYEILVDELRDYRFYSEDMNHPSPLAEEIIWQRFQETFMSGETIARCDEADRANRRAAHRPLHQL